MGTSADRAPRPPLTTRLARSHWVTIDCLVAAGAAAVLLFHTGHVRDVGHQVPGAVGVVLTLAVTLPVAVRRFAPAPALVVVTAAACTLNMLGRTPILVDVTLGMTIYTTAVQSRRVIAIAGFLVTEAAVGSVGLAAVAGSPSQVSAIRLVTTSGALWFIGYSVRERRKYLSFQQEQALHRQRAEQERSSQALRDERVRIARELHDVVAHSLAVITLQAGVGRRIGSRQPAETVRALQAIELMGRSALEEVRRIVGLLFYNDAERPCLAPQPGAGNLGELTDAVCSAGVPARLVLHGDVTGLQPTLSLTVYRIVQEALTNVIKHAPGAAADVLVEIGPDGVKIEVTDNGQGAASVVQNHQAAAARSPDGGGHGILGMRERATAFGGTLKAGPVSGGGFSVTAFLPRGVQTWEQVA
jgi:signal transduction histidine kinase